MAKKTAYLLVGLPHAGLPLIGAALAEHRDALAIAGVCAPAKTVDEVFRAAVEVRREHRAWGLRRKDVEGTWAGLCRRAVKRPGTVVLAHELLAGASPAEIDLILDGLSGCQVHVVVVAGGPDSRVALFPDELDLSAVLARWSSSVPAHRVHVIVAEPGRPDSAWHALGLLVGFDAQSLPLPDPAGLAVAIDTATLRLLAESCGLQADHAELAELAERWATVAAEGGYDVIGDLGDLVPRGPAGSTDPARAAYDLRTEVLSEALVEAVTEVGRLRTRIAELEKLERRERPRVRWAQRIAAS